MRTCPFHNCGKRIPEAMFSCRPHWFSLTKPEQDRIYQCYGDYQADRIDLAELRRQQQEVLGSRGTA